MIGWIVSHAAMQILKPSSTSEMPAERPRELVEAPDEARETPASIRGSGRMTLAQRPVVGHKSAARRARRVPRIRIAPSVPLAASRAVDVSCWLAAQNRQRSHDTSMRSQDEVKNNTFSLAGKRNCDDRNCGEISEIERARCVTEKPAERGDNMLARNRTPANRAVAGEHEARPL